MGAVKRESDFRKQQIIDNVATKLSKEIDRSSKFCLITQLVEMIHIIYSDICYSECK